MPVLCSYSHGCSGTPTGATGSGGDVRAHDEALFRGLDEQYRSEIFAFTYSLSGDRNQADELAQRIFARAYRDSRPRVAR